MISVSLTGWLRCLSDQTLSWQLAACSVPMAERKARAGEPRPLPLLLRKYPWIWVDLSLFGKLDHGHQRRISQRRQDRQSTQPPASRMNPPAGIQIRPRVPSRRANKIVSRRPRADWTSNQRSGHPHRNQPSRRTRVDFSRHAADLLIATRSPMQLRYLLSRLATKTIEAEQHLRSGGREWLRQSGRNSS